MGFFALALAGRRSGTILDGLGAITIVDARIVFEG